MGHFVQRAASAPPLSPETEEEQKEVALVEDEDFKGIEYADEGLFANNTIIGQGGFGIVFTAFDPKLDV